MIPSKYTNMHANKGRAVGFFCLQIYPFYIACFKSVLFVFMCLYNWIYNYASTDKEKSIKEKNIYIII